MSPAGAPSATVSARLLGPPHAVASAIAVEIDRPGQPSQRLPVTEVVPAAPAVDGAPFTVRFDVPRSWAAVRFGYRLVADTSSPASAPPRPSATPPTGGTPADPEPSRRRGRGVHLLCGALLTFGFLIAADGVLTIVWQDPVTAVYAALEQSVLRKDLEQTRTRFAATRTSYPPPPQYRHASAAVASRRLALYDARLFRRSLGTGDAVGTISIPAIDVRFTMVQGTSAAQLRRGPAHYEGTALPGEPGTVAIAGHRTTYLAPFRHLDALHPGDEIALTMPYGRFTYGVVQIGIVDPSSTRVLRQAWGAQWLVLTTCHPVRSAAERIVVVARLRSERVL